MNLQPTTGREQVQPAGRLLYFCSRCPRGLTPRAYQALITRRPHLRQLGWSLKRSQPHVVRRAERDQAILSRMDLDAWFAALTKA